MSATTREDPVTTVKMPRSLRERIARDAADAGQTAAGFLTLMVDRWEREQRLVAVRRAYESLDEASRTDYRAETEAWETATADGIND